MQTSHFWTFSSVRILKLFLKPIVKPFLKPTFLHQNRGPGLCYYPVCSVPALRWRRPRWCRCWSCPRPRCASARWRPRSRPTAQTRSRRTCTRSSGSRPGGSGTDIFFLKHERSIFRQSSNPVYVFSIVEQGRLGVVWPTENWLGSSMKHIQGWKTV